MMSLPIWLPGSTFLHWGLRAWSHIPCGGRGWGWGVFVQGASVWEVSVQRDLCPKGVSVQGSLSMGAFVQGVFVRGFLPRFYQLSFQGSLSREVSVQGVSAQGVSVQVSLCQEDPLYSEERAVRILLECFLGN